MKFYVTSDSDNDNLSYAILFSYDNGTTYNTIVLDLNETLYVVNSLHLLNCDACRIKVLVTDGVNTNDSIIKNLIIKNTLKNITELIVVYSNNKERTFRFIINNPTADIFSNISWNLNTGENNISSEFNTSLLPKENTINHIFYNYTSYGNYNVNLTVTVDNTEISKIIDVEVI